MSKEKVEKIKEDKKEEIKPQIEKRLKRKEFDFLDSAIACCLFIVLQFAMNFLIDVLPVSLKQSFSVAFILSFLVEAIFVFAVMIVASRRKVEFVNATTMNKKPEGLSILLSVVISLVCLFAFTGLTNVFVNLLYKLGYSSSASLSVPNLLVYLIYVFLICIVPAFCEDLLFRGCILSGLRKLGDNKAVILSALIFMLMHGGPDQTVHQFVIGLVLGYAFIASGTIWVPIIIHFVNNFTALTMAYITRNVEQTEVVIPTWGQIFLQFAYAVISAIIGIYIVYFCLRTLRNIRDKNEKKQESSQLTSADIKTEEKAQVSEEENSQDLLQMKKDKKLTITLFVVSGIYLVVNWVLALVGGFIL